MIHPSRLLTISGPTATGKTALALQIASKYDGELLSADSRQVYINMDIMTGKDIPSRFAKSHSRLLWHDRYIPYYSDGQTRIWLYDLVYPNEPFSVSHWRECAALVITDILKRRKLPIVVGGTGLYLHSLTRSFEHIDIPPDPELRSKLQAKSAAELFTRLHNLDPSLAARLNSSDRHNPRRLVRAIEIASNKSQEINHRRLGINSDSNTLPKLDILQIGLTAHRELIFERINERVVSRVNSGAEEEVVTLLSHGYGWSLPSMSASGYPVWREYLENFSYRDRSLLRAKLIHSWQQRERQYARRQLTWFGKEPDIHWFDISASPDWHASAESLVHNWYNQH